MNITITVKEAIWLKSVMQNKFHDDEDKKDEIMREKIFNKLPDFLTLYNLKGEDNEYNI